MLGCRVAQLEAFILFISHTHVCMYVCMSSMSVLVLVLKSLFRKLKVDSRALNYLYSPISVLLAAYMLSSKLFFFSVPYIILS